MCGDEFFQAGRTRYHTRFNTGIFLWPEVAVPLAVSIFFPPIYPCWLFFFFFWFKHVDYSLSTTKAWFRGCATWNFITPPLLPRGDPEEERKRNLGWLTIRIAFCERELCELLPNCLQDNDFIFVGHNMESTSCTKHTSKRNGLDCDVWPTFMWILRRWCLFQKLFSVVTLLVHIVRFPSLYWNFPHVLAFVVLYFVLVLLLFLGVSSPFRFPISWLEK